jgi:hypothetical protein
MYPLVSIGVLDSSRGRGGDRVRTSVVNGVATAYYTPLTGELCKKPIVDSLTISSNPAQYAEDSVLTATLVGHVNGPFGEGTHQYQWYELSSTSGGTLTAIVGATSSTFTITSAEVGAYIVCAARYVQDAGGNNASDWYYSEPTPIVVAGTGGDIVFAWEDDLKIESGLSIPSDWSDTTVASELINYGTGDNWTAGATSKPEYVTNKLVFDKTLSHKIVAGDSSTHPPKFEVWMKLQFTATTGNALTFGSNGLLGIDSSTKFTAKGMTATTGDLNEHVFRLVYNGASSFLQIDNGTPITFTESTTTASFLTLGRNYTGGSPASFYLKKFQRTPYNTFLSNAERDAKWIYHGY